MSVNKLLAILILVTFVAGCKKDSNNVYQSQGVLLGPDMGMCPMCGGLKVEIKNDTTKNAPSFYRTTTDLTKLGLTHTLSYPVNVSLNWYHNSATPGDTYIIITKIKADN